MARNLTWGLPWNLAWDLPWSLAGDLSWSLAGDLSGLIAKQSRKQSGSWVGTKWGAVTEPVLACRRVPWSTWGITATKQLSEWVRLAAETVLCTALAATESLELGQRVLLTTETILSARIT
ncbi:MAG TPA: hypothetical protein V6C52_12325 [Coleofasciculaceae cyanobacterium]